MKNITVPKHIAIIPDGNRRWAKEQGEKPWIGHKVAAENLEHIVDTARELGVEYMTLWGSSLENLEKRPLAEKKALLDIYKTFFKKLISSDKIMKYGVRVRVIGQWREKFPKVLVNLFENGIEKTKKNTKFNLTLCLAYSGDDEMISAIKSIVESGVGANEISGEHIKRNLMTSDLPPVDYMIRTGGEPHLSVGFMMWDIANTQLFFTEKLCPDFDEKAFRVALEEYASRGRRHGA